MLVHCRTAAAWSTRLGSSCSRAILSTVVAPPQIVSYFSRGHRQLRTDTMPGQFCMRMWTKSDRLAYPLSVGNMSVNTSNPRAACSTGRRVTLAAWALSSTQPDLPTRQARVPPVVGGVPTVENPPADSGVKMIVTTKYKSERRIISQEQLSRGTLPAVIISCCGCICVPQWRQPAYLLKPQRPAYEPTHAENDPWPQSLAVDRFHQAS